MKKIIILVLVYLFLVIPACQLPDDNSSVYGDEIPIFGKLNIGRCMDAAVDGSTLFVIGNRSIYSFDISSAIKRIPCSWQMLSSS